MMKTRLYAIFCVACSVLLIGCGTTAHKTFRFEPTMGKPIAVDIENPRGDVVVRGDGDEGVVRVSASRFVSDSSMEGESEDVREAVEGWSRDDLDVQLVEQGGGTVLRVRPGARTVEMGARVDVFIEMPSLDGTEIRNAKGSVVLVDPRGAMRVHNQFGAIDIRTSHPIGEDIELTTTEGNIYLQVPSGSDAEVDLLTLDGTISYRDKLNRTSGPHTNDSNTLTAFMGAGGNRLTARTDEGNIFVWMMEEPMAYTRLIRPITKNPIAYMFLKGSRRHTRELPEDHAEIMEYDDPRDHTYR